MLYTFWDNTNLYSTESLTYCSLCTLQIRVSCSLNQLDLTYKWPGAVYRPLVKHRRLGRNLKLRACAVHFFVWGLLLLGLAVSRLQGFYRFGVQNGLLASICNFRRLYQFLNPCHRRPYAALLTYSSSFVMVSSLINARVILRQGK